MTDDNLGLRVTDVRIYPTDDLKNTIGFAHVVISDALIIRDLRLVRGKKGLFVSMPAFHRRDGKFRDIVSPLSQKMRDLLTSAVVDAYRREHPQTVAREDIYHPLQHSSDSVGTI